MKPLRSRADRLTLEQARARLLQTPYVMLVTDRFMKGGVEQVTLKLTKIESIDIDFSKYYFYPDDVAAAPGRPEIKCLVVPNALVGEDFE